jgi:hypothetical protein
MFVDYFYREVTIDPCASKMAAKVIFFGGCITCV